MHQFSFQRTNYQHTPVTQAVFIVPPQVHLLDVAGPAQIFYEAADYGAPVTSYFAGIFPADERVESSSHLCFSDLRDYNTLQLKKNDLVFIPGLERALLLDDAFLRTTAPFRRWLQEQHAKGVIICSVCTGAFLLAEAGLLQDQACTTHWKYTERLQQRYPGLQVKENCLFVQSGTVLTSAGVASGIDLALYIVEQLWGSAFAAQVAREVVVFNRRSAADPQLSVFLQYRNHLNNRIHTIQDLLAQTLDKKLSIEALAEQIHMSPRNLTRLFKSTTGITIGQYLDKLRVERSQQMIGEGHTMHTVAAACGLKSTNQLRQLLKKYRGMVRA
ncbi:GlxA family transcriptional regulator [Chitinophaga japonensis]|uniref:Transcriptional regulator GlxA family with amidase domain n=1 Tax=Chitinophaga japonensis TaxID=104662 RepID=A0A562TGG4_CHIJA|nr:DJ-1/PfpI family protein [Chitinophaga japonensis]TWI92136.1 transcriptional regulator GlxA family with amidase domain [Chitinophaga japonensis]